MWRCHGLLQYRPFGPGKGMTLSSPASDFQEIDFGNRTPAITSKGLSGHYSISPFRPLVHPIQAYRRNRTNSNRIDLVLDRLYPLAALFGEHYQLCIIFYLPNC